MPISTDILVTARELMRIYGKDAADEARRMCGRLSDRKLSEGVAFWQDVYLALGTGKTQPGPTAGTV